MGKGFFSHKTKPDADRYGGRSASKTLDCTGLGATTLFTVTGDVVIRLFAVCKAAFTTSDAITAEVGVAGNIACIIAQVADATALAQHEIWHDATPDATVEAESVVREFIISNGQDVLLTLTGTITAGTLAFYLAWRPLSADGWVSAA